MKITNPITLDVARSNSYICLLAKQFDSNSRYLEITLADNGQPLTIPADASAVLRATRADGTGAVVSGTVANGKATVEIDDYILEVAGAVTLSLEISKGGEILTTTHCNLTVQKADANGWIRVYVADANKVAGNYYITIGGVSYSFTTSQAIPTGGSVYFSSNNATAETRNATGTVIETGLVLTEGTTGTQLVSDVPTMSFLATIAGRVAALESEMPNKADKDGIIALAENLTPYSSTSGATQSVPFINQGTGCGNGESIIDTGSYCQSKKKLGNTASVNQLRNTQSGATSSTGNYGQMAPEILSGLVYGRYYYVAFDVKEAADNVDTADYWFKLGNMGYSHYSILISSSASWTHYAKIAKLTLTGGTEGSGSAFQKAGNTDKKSIEYKNLVVVDVSRWFGSDANIPAHLLSHPEDFGRYYSGSLAANPGQLVNADGSMLTSIGRNVWDEEWEVGIYNTSTGAKQSSSTRIRSKNLIPVIPNTAYYFRASANRELLQYDSAGNFIYYDSVDTSNQPFTTLPNCHFIAFSMYSGYGTTYLNNITISLYYSGESGYNQYYPYSVLAQIDTGSEVLRSAGAVADEKTPDGTITRRVGVVDLGTLNWSYSSGVTMFYTQLGATQTQYNYQGICGKYSKGSTTPNDKEWSNGNYMGSGLNLYIKDSAYTDAAAFKTAMSGVYLFYELATPTTEQGTPFAENIPCDDFGSMYWEQTKGVPQGVEIFYPYDYKAAVDTILNEVNGDVTKLVTAEKVPDAPSSNGTYVLKVTVSDGTPTYSWVAE